MSSPIYQQKANKQFHETIDTVPQFLGTVMSCLGAVPVGLVSTWVLETHHQSRLTYATHGTIALMRMTCKGNTTHIRGRGIEGSRRLTSWATAVSSSVTAESSPHHRFIFFFSFSVRILNVQDYLVSSMSDACPIPSSIWLQIMMFLAI